MDTKKLLQELRVVVEEQQQRARAIRAMDPRRLQHRTAPDQWTVLEVFEHLVLSSGVYSRGLRRAFDKDVPAKPFDAVFSPGMLGNYFTKGMLPDASGGLRFRMRTMRMFDPAKQTGASLASIDRFIALCDDLLGLLEEAGGRNLNKLKVVSSLGWTVRFKAGDAFRFPIAHQQRHFLQIERILASSMGA